MSFTYRASIAFGTTDLSPTVEVGVAGTYGAPVSLTESVSGSGTYEATVTVDVNDTLLYSDGQGNYSIETIPAAAGGGGSAPTVQQMWDELLTNLTTEGSVGKSLADMLAAFSAMIENVSGERFTAHALMEAPSGSGTVNANVIQWAGQTVLATPTGTVVSGATPTGFVSDLSYTVDVVSGSLLRITSGLLIGAWTIVQSYDTTTHAIVCDPPLPGTPANGVEFALLPEGYSVYAIARALAGTGARAITITVNDGTNPLPGAQVRLTSGASVFVATSDGSGVAHFNLNDGTYMASIDLIGYGYTPASLTTDSTHTAFTLSLTAFTTVPASAPLCNVSGDFKQPDGSLAANVVFTFTLMENKPAKAGGFVLASRDVTATTDSSGHLALTLERNDQITPAGSSYRVKCDAVRIAPYTTITLTSGSYDISSLAV